MDNEKKMKMIGLEWRHRQAEKELLEFCRVALASLKDHKLDHLAHELGAKVFAVDLIRGEVDEIIKADPLGALKLALDGLKGEK